MNPMPHERDYNLFYVEPPEQGDSATRRTTKRPERRLQQRLKHLQYWTSCSRVVYCTSCARVCVLYIVCTCLCTVLYIICMCGIVMFSTVADRHFSFQFCIYIFRFLFSVFHWPKNDPRNTLLFHKKCTITVTNRFPDSTYRQAQRSPSANNGMNTSLLA